MREIGTWNGEPVGCFVLLRSGPLRVPVMTIHRVTRRLARHFADGFEQEGVAYEVVGVESVCDCQGALELEP